MYSLLHQVKSVRDATLKLFWHFPVGTFHTIKKRSKVWFMLFCFAEFSTFPGKIYWNPFTLEPIPYIDLLCSEEPRLDLALRFGRTKFQPIRFFRRRLFVCRCITLEFGIFKLCKYFLYLLTCFLGCNKAWCCRSWRRSRSAKGWVCGWKPCANIVGVYVFVFYIWFSSRNSVPSSGTFFV